VCFPSSGLSLLRRSLAPVFRQDMQDRLHHGPYCLRASRKRCLRSDPAAPIGQKTQPATAGLARETAEAINDDGTGDSSRVLHRRSPGTPVPSIDRAAPDGTTCPAALSKGFPSRRTFRAGLMFLCNSRSAAMREVQHVILDRRRRSFYRNLSRRWFIELPRRRGQVAGCRRFTYPSARALGYFV
jgi:hypothetical protein